MPLSHLTEQSDEPGFFSRMRAIPGRAFEEIRTLPWMLPRAVKELAIGAGHDIWNAPRIIFDDDKDSRIAREVWESMKRTASSGADWGLFGPGVQTATMVRGGGFQDQQERRIQDLRDFEESPFFMPLEHIGNLALGGLGAGVALKGASRAAGQAGRLAKASGARADTLAKFNSRARALDQAGDVSINVLSHPYIMSYRGLKQAKPTQALRGRLPEQQRLGRVPDDILSEHGPVTQAAIRGREKLQASEAWQSVFNREGRVTRRGTMEATNEIVRTANEARAQYSPQAAERVVISRLNEIRKNSPELWEKLEPNMPDISGRLERAGQVLAGQRPYGTAQNPQQLKQILDALDQHVRELSSSGIPFREAFNNVLPNVEPMTFALLRAEAAARTHGIDPQPVLNYIGDRIQLDHHADLLRRTNQALREGGQDPATILGERFTIPEAELGTQINRLPNEVQQAVNESINSYMEYVGKVREPRLLEQGVIPERGMRTNLGPEDPTKYQTTIDHPNAAQTETVPVAWATERGRVDATQLRDRSRGPEYNKVRDSIAEEGIREPLVYDQAGNLVEGNRRLAAALELGIDRVPVTLRGVARTDRMRPSRAFPELEGQARAWTEQDIVLDPSTRERLRNLTRQEQEIVRNLEDSPHRPIEEVQQLQQELDTVRRSITETEQVIDAALVDAPVTARDLLALSNRVGERARATFETMLENNTGNPDVLRALIDELDRMPRTLEALDQAGLRTAYLRNQVLSPEGQATRYGTRTPPGQPSPTRFRGVSDAPIVRDLRARMFLGEQHMNRWEIANDLDTFLKNEKVVRSGEDILIEDFGYSRGQVRAMTDDAKTRLLRSQGFEQYQVSELWPDIQRPLGRRGAPEETFWTNKYASKAMKDMFREPGRIEKILMEGMYDPSIRGFKVAALPLRPAWQVNNALGNMTLTMLVGGVNPFNYGALLRGSFKATREWHKGNPGELAIPMDKGLRTAVTQRRNRPDITDAEKADLTRALEEGVIRIPDEVLRDITSGGIARGDFAWLNNTKFLQELGAQGPQNILRQLGVQPETPATLAGIGDALRNPRKAGANLRQSGSEVVNYSYHINTWVDDAHRTIIYMDTMRQRIPQVMREQNLSLEQATQLVHSEALTRITRALADYSKLTPFERRFLKRVYPFYPWMRHVVWASSNMFRPENISRTVLTAHLVHLFGQPNEFEELLPDWAGGHIYAGETEDGLPQFISTRGLNPYLDVFDPLAQPNMRGLLRPAAPQIGAMAEHLTGISNLTGRPITGPVREASGLPSRPSAGEHFIRSIPQLRLGRDIRAELRGEPLTRFGTGETRYDLPDTGEGRTAGRAIGQYLGLNIQVMDVERMAQREKVREYREELDRRRHEFLQQQHREQEGRSTLEGIRQLLPGG